MLELHVRYFVKMLNSALASLMGRREYIVFNNYLLEPAVSNTLSRDCQIVDFANLLFKYSELANNGSLVKLLVFMNE
jgi:hypothetical protein